jgi:type I restriction enzyme S subunit
MTTTPSGKWRDARLADLVFFQRGFDITQAQQRPGQYPVISSSGVTSHHDEFKAVGPGVIIGRKGTLGSIHFSESNYWPHDTTLWSKDLRGHNSRFVYYFLHTIDFRRFDVGNSNPTLNRNHIHDLQIRIPPPPIQHTIAEILSSYDDLIENNRRRMALLEQAARHLYEEWFVRLRFPGHEHAKIANGFPTGWDRKRIGEVAECVGGGTPSTSNPAYWEEGTITWVTPTDVTRNQHFVLLDAERKITPAGLQNSSARLVPPHAVLMTSRASVGFFAIAGREVCTNQGFISIVPSDPVFSAFLLFQLCHRVEEIRAMGSGSTYPEVSRGKFREFMIAVPPRSLIADFAGSASPLLKMIRVLKQQNQQLKTARDLLLPRLMSGEIAV